VLGAGDPLTDGQQRGELVVLRDEDQSLRLAEIIRAWRGAARGRPGRPPWLCQPQLARQ